MPTTASARHTWMPATKRGPLCIIEKPSNSIRKTPARAQCCERWKAIEEHDMFHSTLLLLHICCATIGLLSGFLSMALRKGSSPHRIAGNMFFVSMLLMSSSAVYMAAFLKPNMINVIAGLLTFYLVGTGWWAGKRRDGGTSL